MDYLAPVCLLALAMLLLADGLLRRRATVREQRHRRRLREREQRLHEEWRARGLPPDP